MNEQKAKNVERRTGQCLWRSLQNFWITIVKNENCSEIVLPLATNY